MHRLKLFHHIITHPKNRLFTLMDELSFGVLVFIWRMKKGNYHRFFFFTFILSPKKIIVIIKTDCIICSNKKRNAAHRGNKHSSRLNAYEHNQNSSNFKIPNPQHNHQKQRQCIFSVEQYTWWILKPQNQ